MTLRSIITLPDEKILRMNSEPVTGVDSDVKAIWEDMLETMYDAPGIGLAAIQIAVPKRLIVIDIAKDGEPRTPLFLANPKITWFSKDQSDYEEGCLSIPDYYEMVQRPKEIKLHYLDRQNEAQDIHATGLLATVIQHEMDHLDGILFIDHLTKLKRDRVVKKFQKAQKLGKI